MSQSGIFIILIEVCTSGQEDVAGVCVSCSVGYYKNNDDGSDSLAQYSSCTRCSVEWITADVGSASVDDCIIGRKKLYSGSVLLW